MVTIPLIKAQTCSCRSRPAWAPIEDDLIMHWQTVDIGEWEELRQCPECASTWLAVWLDEGESPPILCRPVPSHIKRLRELDKAATLRPYCLTKLEEHLGDLREQKLTCRKVRCSRKRIATTGYCIEHLIAERFGRHFARLGNPEETSDEVK
jgi:hypothetical protein